MFAGLFVIDTHIHILEFEKARETKVNVYKIIRQNQINKRKVCAFVFSETSARQLYLLCLVKGKKLLTFLN